MNSLTDRATCVDLGSIAIEYDGPQLDVSTMGSFHLLVGRMFILVEEILRETYYQPSQGTMTLVSEYNRLVDNVQASFVKRGEKNLEDFLAESRALGEKILALDLANDAIWRELAEQIVLVETALKTLVAEGKTAPRFWDDWAMHQLQATTQAVVTSIQVGSLYETILFVARQPDTRAILQNFAANILWVIFAAGCRFVIGMSDGSGIPSHMSFANVNRRSDNPPHEPITNPHRKEDIASMVEEIVKVLAINGGGGAELKLKHKSTQGKDEMVLHIRIPYKKQL